MKIFCKNNDITKLARKNLKRRRKNGDELLWCELGIIYFHKHNSRCYKKELKKYKEKYKYYDTWRDEIYVAIRDNDLDKVKEIEKTPGFHTETSNYFGETPIQYAKIYGRTEIYEYLDKNVYGESKSN